MKVSSVLTLSFMVVWIATLATADIKPKARPDLFPVGCYTMTSGVLVCFNTGAIRPKPNPQYLK